MHQFVSAFMWSCVLFFGWNFVSTETTRQIFLRCRFFFYFLRKEYSACVRELPRTSIRDIHTMWNNMTKDVFYISSKSLPGGEKSVEAKWAGEEGWMSVNFTKRRSMKKTWSQRDGTSCYCCCFQSPNFTLLLSVAVKEAHWQKKRWHLSTCLRIFWVETSLSISLSC